MAEDFKYIRFMVFKASNIKYLFEQLDDEPRPFELVVHQPISKIGVRPVTLRQLYKEGVVGFCKTLNQPAFFQK